MYCSECGNQVNAEAKFCPKCGTVQADGAPTTSAAVPAPVKPKMAQGKKTLLYVGGGLLALVIAAGIYGEKKEQSKASVNSTEPSDSAATQSKDEALPSTPTAVSDEEKSKNAATDIETQAEYKKVNSVSLAIQYTTDPFSARNMLGQLIETQIFADKFMDEGDVARVLDGNSGFYCRMSGSEYSKHNGRGAMVIRGKLSEIKGFGLGLENCVFVSKELDWKADN